MVSMSAKRYNAQRPIGLTTTAVITGDVNSCARTVEQATASMDDKNLVAKTVGKAIVNMAGSSTSAKTAGQVCLYFFDARDQGCTCVSHALLCPSSSFSKTFALSQTVSAFHILQHRL
jgi:hypothetical protein